MDNADDQGGEPLDCNYSSKDMAPETPACMKTDCEEFQRDHAADIAAETERGSHDYRLTRNHHS